jgi:GNAT superfamily N-acetyltransferase
MSLSDGYYDLPAGKLANVVTCLEMCSPVPTRPGPELSGTAIERITDPDIDRFHALVRRVGEAYLWQSPMLRTAEQLRSLLKDGRVELYALQSGGEDHGILELDFRDAGICELHLFGVSAHVQGTGAARKLMNFAIAQAWSHPITRLWLHTCTLDHPDALPFYIRSGFVPFKRQIEIHDDPRVTGLYPHTVAPHVPVI